MVDRPMRHSSRGMPTWGVHDDDGCCIAIVTHVRRGAWWVEDYTSDTTACFRSKSQAFYYAQHVIGG